MMHTAHEQETQIIRESHAHDVPRRPVTSSAGVGSGGGVGSEVALWILQLQLTPPTLPLSRFMWESQTVSVEEICPLSWSEMQESYFSSTKNIRPAGPNEMLSVINPIYLRVELCNNSKVVCAM